MCFPKHSYHIQTSFYSWRKTFDICFVFFKTFEKHHQKNGTLMLKKNYSFGSNYGEKLKTPIQTENRMLSNMPVSYLTKRQAPCEKIPLKFCASRPVQRRSTSAAACVQPSLASC